MSAHLAKPDRAQLTAYLESQDWNRRDASRFIDLNWRLIGTATYDDWEELAVAYAEAQG